MGIIIIAYLVAGGALAFYTFCKTKRISLRQFMITFLGLLITAITWPIFVGMALYSFIKKLSHRG